MRIVAFSDTHGKHREIPEVPDGDVLIFAGDFSEHGKISEVRDFAEWLGNLPHEHKLVIAGNHDFCMERSGRKKRMAKDRFMANGITYLEDEAYSIEGVTFYGSPFSNTFDRYVFNDGMPKVCEDTDILITHGPPTGKLDFLEGHGNIGSDEVLDEVERCDPDLHIFGHVHEQFGREGKFCNVSLLNPDYRMDSSPLVIELEDY